MNRIKTSIALLCCLVVFQLLCLAETPLPAFLTSATADTVMIDDTVYLLVDLKDNVGFGAAQFCIAYDAEKLQFESVTLGEILSGGAITHVNTDVVGEINFSVISLENISASGTVLISKFKAVAVGDAKFDFKLLAFADSSTATLDATSSDTEITIRSNETTTTPPVTTSPPIVVTPPTPWVPPVTDAPPVTTSPPEPDLSPDAGSDFTDVPESHWAYKYICDAAASGLFRGTGENLFSPEAPMTRAMFVTVLHRYADSPTPKHENTFTDVPADEWYTDAVTWAAENGVVNGMGDNLFMPHRYITRGEITAVLYRYASGSVKRPGILRGFLDADLIPDWGIESMAWAVENGLIGGRTLTRIAFSEDATRAEAAAVLMRYLDMK